MEYIYFKIFQHNSKAALCPLFVLFVFVEKNEKNAIWRNLLSIQNEAISLAW